MQLPWFHIRGACIAPGCVYRLSNAKRGMGIPGDHVKRVETYHAPQSVSHFKSGCTCWCVVNESGYSRDEHHSFTKHLRPRDRRRLRHRVQRTVRRRPLQRHVRRLPTRRRNHCTCTTGALAASFMTILRLLARQTRLPGATDNSRYGEGRASPRSFLTLPTSPRHPSRRRPNHPQRRELAHAPRLGSRTVPR